MSDRPRSPDENADEPTEPGAAGPGADAAASGDAWSDAVDRPGADTGQSRMGFSGSTSGAQPTGDDLGALGEMMQRLLGGASGGTGMPDLGDLVRQLGGAGGGGQVPDLSELIRQLGGMTGAGGDPLQQLFKSMGVDPNDSGLLAMLQGQLAQFLKPQTPQSRMTMATDMARKTVASGDSDPTVTAAQQREVTDAVRVAELWIDPVTTLDAPHGTGLAWSRAEWVEATMPTWHRLVEPVSSGVTAAIANALNAQMGRLGAEGLGEGMPQIPGLDLGGLMAQLRPALEQLAGGMFSAQLGHGVGVLAADLLSGTEVGLPLLATEDVALLPTNVAVFTEGLGVDPGEVRLYLAVREAARARLFAEVPWLGPQLEAAVRDYANNITIDTDAIEEQLRSVDIQDPAAIQEALQHKLFSPSPTPAQQAALGRLETSLALVEGWVDVVTEQATAPHLPQADALGEALRRRRVGGPAQKTFSGLVGLDLRPRRLKDAKNLWLALENAGGKEFRDAPWAHPDIAPTGADLDDPLGYVEKRRDAGAGDDVDSALDALLRGSEPPTDDPGAAPRA